MNDNIYHVNVCCESTNQALFQLTKYVLKEKHYKFCVSITTEKSVCQSKSTLRIFRNQLDCCQNTEKMLKVHKMFLFIFQNSMFCFEVMMDENDLSESMSSFFQSKRERIYFLPFKICHSIPYS